MYCSAFIFLRGEKDMEKTASQIQKERIKELEEKANLLIEKCNVATLTSINEKGYPRTCVLSIAKQMVFLIYTL